MSESSNQQVNDRAIVIQRGNELSEFVALLADLGVPTDVFSGGLPTAEDLHGAAVVVIPGKRLAESGTPNLSLWPRTVAVVDQSSKTIISHLNRLGAALVVRRPIHPRTLRLLLLHEIYRGPERRRKKRILIGHPIRVGVGLFKQRATLLELSPGGARIELPSAPKIGSTLKIMIGKDLTQAKPLKLQAKVVRCIRPAGDRGRGDSEIGVALISPQKQAQTIRSILDRFATGPASWNGAVAAQSPTSEAPHQSQPNIKSTVPDAAEPDTVAAPEPSIEEIDPEVSARRLPPSATAMAAPDAEAAKHDGACERTPDAEKSASDETDSCEALEQTDQEQLDRELSLVTEIEDGDENTDEGEAGPAASEDESERRSETRIPYERRVVALGEEAARVLVGRDLSQGGMRIAANDAVDLGDVLRVALHCGTEIEPVVVTAKADRDDGDRGTVLTFQDVSDNQRSHLEKIIASSSPIESAVAGHDPNEHTQPGSIVLGEMIETIEKGPAPPPSAVKTEEQIEAHLDSIFDTDESI